MGDAAAVTLAAAATVEDIALSDVAAACDTAALV